MTHHEPNHDELDRSLGRLRMGVGASDLHGSLTGFLCAGGKADANSWLDALALDAADDDWREDDVFARLLNLCRTQLEDPDLGFEPLLPADSAALPVRAGALVDWCRGFLGGVGLAGAGSAVALSEDAEEILRDLGTIAATDFAFDEDEDDERALTEVLEFVRIGVLLLHGELNAPLRGVSIDSVSRRLH